MPRIPDNEIAYFQQIMQQMARQQQSQQAAAGGRGAEAGAAAGAGAGGDDAAAQAQHMQVRRGWAGQGRQGWGLVGQGWRTQVGEWIVALLGAAGGPHNFIDMFEMCQDIPRFVPHRWTSGSWRLWSC